MPFLLIPILIGAASVAISGVAYGIDQNDKREAEQRKREQEQAAFRRYREQMESALASKEAELASLRVLLGESDMRTRLALAEVERLYALLADLARAA